MRETEGPAPTAPAAAKAEAAAIDEPLRGVGVQSDDHVLAVATIGPGEPPAVAITGSGLDATIAIGARTYRFDGTTVVVGDR